MEPERKIEKLLRAYAEKRRTDAGDPLKLHPATRRLLHDEVSRQMPKPGSEETSFSLWQLFRQQWAFLSAFALLAFLGGTLLLPALSSAKHKAQSVEAMNNLRQIGIAAQTLAGENNGKWPASLDELTNGLITPQTLIDPVSGKQFVYVAGGSNLDTSKNTNLLAYSPVDKDGRAVLLADGSVEYVSAPRFAELTNQRSVELALAKNVTRRQNVSMLNASSAAATTPPLMEPAAQPEKEYPGGAATSQSTQTYGTAGTINMYRNVSASAQAVPVLQSFQWTQSGNTVSVVDRDGSIYRGTVQVATGTESSEEELKVPPGAGTALRQGEANAMQSASNQQQAAGNYFFRVAGMNRTLSQNVVFSGNVEPIAGVTMNKQETSNGGAIAGQVSQDHLQVSTNQQQQQFSNLHLVGSAVIDRTNRIEIDAVPAVR